MKTIISFFFLSISCLLLGQNKKEQIEALNYRVDSLKGVIQHNNKMNSDKVNDLNMKLSTASGTIEEQKTTIQELNNDKSKLENQVNTLTTENSELSSIIQQKSDSLKMLTENKEPYSYYYGENFSKKHLYDSIHYEEIYNYKKGETVEAAVYDELVCAWILNNAEKKIICTESSDATISYTDFRIDGMRWALGYTIEGDDHSEKYLIFYSNSGNAVMQRIYYGSAFGGGYSVDVHYDVNMEIHKCVINDAKDASLLRNLKGKYGDTYDMIGISPDLNDTSKMLNAYYQIPNIVPCPDWMSSPSFIDE